MNKFILYIILFHLLSINLYSQTVNIQNTTATWIWYPGDFEIWLNREVSILREHNSKIFPPFWRLDTHYGSVKFIKKYNLEKPDTVEVFSTGNYTIWIDEYYALYDFNPQKLVLPSGNHTISITVVNYERLPSIFIKGKAIITDSTWLITCYDGDLLNVSYWNFNDCTIAPINYKLNTLEIFPIEQKNADNSILLDFGKETFGYIKLNGWKGRGLLSFYYGESKEEALAKEESVLFNRININFDTITSDYIYQKSKALRFLYIEFDKNFTPGSVSLMYEYLPVKQRGEFKCSNETINKIWDISTYTLQLTTREFMLDGIKRDRWLWSGDALQSYLMNYYLFFDKEVNKRTIIALRGKDPVKKHINTILDYSFYWFISIYDYYLYTGDIDFIKQIYPKMKSQMDFCLDRRNNEGFVEGLKDDWVFIDWGNIPKKGEVCFEQILLIRSLETMSLCAEALGDSVSSKYYHQLSSDLKKKTIEVFWDLKKGNLLHSRESGVLSELVTQYPNMFAILYGMLDSAQQESVKNNSLLNDSINKITTPYMKLYELSALCELEKYSFVLKNVQDYWGGMLKLGATTFWEEYIPTQVGLEHYNMHGYPFNKSLCHAWGASPIYLFGKYFLGVKPLSPGYKSFEVKPHLGGLKWIEGKVPIFQGEVYVFINQNKIIINSPKSGGICKFKSKTNPKTNIGIIEKIGQYEYQITLEKINTNYEIKYQNFESTLLK